MTALLVDLEHEAVVVDPARASEHRRKVRGAAAVLRALSGLDCRVVHYRRVLPGPVEEVGARAVVVGGATADWADYDPEALSGLLALILDPPVPLLGICAGHQLS